MAAITAIGLGAALSLFQVPVSAGDTLLVGQQFVGSFGNASRIGVDASGQVYVIDEDRHTISRFRNLSEQAQTIGGYGWDATTFDKPTAVATDGLNVYVSDYGNHRVIRYDRNFNFVSSLSTRDTSYSPAQFGYPLGLALSRQGDLFVLDGENLRVVQFDSRSEFKRSFGTIESREGRLHDPIEVTVFRDDKITVLERDRIVEFDFVGNYVRSIGEGAIRNSRGMCETQNGFLVAANDTLMWFDTDGTLRTQVAASTILGEYSVSPLRDVAVWKDRILLLSPSRVGVFRIESGVR